MRAIVQRVSSASLITEDHSCSIARGMVALIGVEKADTEQNMARMCERLLGYRIFADNDGRMNLSLRDIAGELLLVPNFTVAADTRKGTRAGFSTAAAPEHGAQLFNQLCEELQSRHPAIETGIFGADMQITLCNDGPVTFILES